MRLRCLDEADDVPVEPPEPPLELPPAPPSPAPPSVSPTMSRVFTPQPPRSRTKDSSRTRDRFNAVARINENVLIVGWVQHSLRARAKCYHFVLERLVIALPSPAAIEAERVLQQLETALQQNVVVAAFGVASRPIISK